MVSDFGAAHPYLFQMLVPPPPPRAILQRLDSLGIEALILII